MTMPEGITEGTCRAIPGGTSRKIGTDFLEEFTNKFLKKWNDM